MDDNVHGRIGIPLWAFGMESDIKIGDHEGHVDKDFWNFFDHLDFEAPIKVEIRKGRFFFYADMIYAKMSKELEPRGVFAASGANGELTLKQLMAGLNLGYELVREPNGSLTAFAGGRMSYIKAEIDINAPAFSTSNSKTKFIGDPVIGLYGTYDINYWLGLYVKGDVGGFGLIGDHFTWQVEPGVDFRTSAHTYIRAAWRALGIDYAKNNFKYDATFMGPQLEIGWRF
jgi:hypothetical protein